MAIKLIYRINDGKNVFAAGIGYGTFSNPNSIDIETVTTLKIKLGNENTDALLKFDETIKDDKALRNLLIGKEIIVDYPPVKMPQTYFEFRDASENSPAEYVIKAVEVNEKYNATSVTFGEFPFILTLGRGSNTGERAKQKPVKMPEEHFKNNK